MKTTSASTARTRRRVGVTLATRHQPHHSCCKLPQATVCSSCGAAGAVGVISTPLAFGAQSSEPTASPPAPPRTPTLPPPEALPNGATTALSTTLARPNSRWTFARTRTSILRKTKIPPLKVRGAGGVDKRAAPRQASDRIRVATPRGLRVSAFRSGSLCFVKDGLTFSVVSIDQRAKPS